MSVPCATCCALATLINSYIIKNKLSIILKTEGAPVGVGLVESKGVTVTVDGKACDAIVAECLTCAVVESYVCNKLNYVTVICSCDSLFNSGVTDVADLSNEGYGSKNSCTAYGNGYIVIRIGVAVLLVVPKLVAGNVACMGVKGLWLML
jgi:hypothetical protein